MPLIDHRDQATRRTVEPKPYEPRGRILYGLTPEGVLLGQQVEAMLEAEENQALLADGHKLLCMNPDALPPIEKATNSVKHAKATVG